MKKGGVFVGYEWIVLPERGFDPNNKDHVRVKEGIEVGNGLPTLATAADVVKALEDSGFEVLEYYDAVWNVYVNVMNEVKSTREDLLKEYEFYASQLPRPQQALIG